MLGKCNIRFIKSINSIALRSSALPISPFNNIRAYSNLRDTNRKLLNQIDELQNKLNEYKKLGDINDLKHYTDVYKIMEPKLTADKTDISGLKNTYVFIRPIALMCAAMCIIIIPKISMWIILYRYCQRLYMRNDLAGWMFIIFTMAMLGAC